MPSGTIVSGSHQVEAEAETYPRGLTLVGVPSGTIVLIVSGMNALLPRLKPGRRKPNTCSRTVEATL